MKSKKILLEQMRACHNQTSWFITANTAISGLTAEQASWHDRSTNNSIWQIVTSWKQQGTWDKTKGVN